MMNGLVLWGKNYALLFVLIHEDGNCMLQIKWLRGISTKEKKILLPKECPKCAFLKPPKTKVCPSCGFDPMPVSGVDVEEGELHELTRDGRVKVEKWPIERK